MTFYVLPGVFSTESPFWGIKMAEGLSGCCRRTLLSRWFGIFEYPIYERGHPPIIPGFLLKLESGRLRH